MTLQGALEVLNQGPILLSRRKGPGGEFEELMQLYRVHYLGSMGGVQYIFTQASGWETAQAGSHVFGVTAYQFLGDFLILRMDDGAEFGLDFGGTPEEEANFAAQRAVEMRDPDGYRAKERLAIQWALSLTPLEGN